MSEVRVVNNVRKGVSAIHIRVNIWVYICGLVWANIVGVRVDVGVRVRVRVVRVDIVIVIVIVRAHIVDVRVDIVRVNVVRVNVVGVNVVKVNVIRVDVIRVDVIRVDVVVRIDVVVYIRDHIVCDRFCFYFWFFLNWLIAFIN